MNRWIKHFLVYGFGTVLLNAIPFFLIPIYTRAVSVSEYGVLELLNRSQDFVLLVITMGMASTVATLYQMEDSEEGKLKLYSTAILFLGMTSLAVLLPLAVACGPISRVLFSTTEYSNLVVMFVAATYFEILFQMSALFLQSELKSSLFVSAYSTRAFLSLGLNSLFAFVFHLGLFGIALAAVIHTVTAALVVAGYTLSRTGVHFRSDRIKGMLKFGLPLVPGGFAMFILNNGDRYFLNAYSTEAIVGIYAVGYKLAAATATLVLMPFLKLWSVKMVDVSRRDDGPELIGTIATMVTGACIMVTLGLSLFAPYLLLLLGKSSYEAAVPVIPVVGCSYVLYAWTVVMDTSLYVTKRTDLKPVALISSCAVILPIYYFLIRQWGMMGAAWATLVGFSVFAAIDYRMAQRVYRVRYQFGRMLKVLVIAASAWLLSLWAQRISTGDVAIRVLLMLAALTAVWIVVVHKDEQQFIKREIATVRSRIVG
jgi:O-antigen/teichoic acid export membrane protein